MANQRITAPETPRGLFAANPSTPSVDLPARVVRVIVRFGQLVPDSVAYTVAGWVGDVLSMAARGMRRQFDHNVRLALDTPSATKPSVRRRAFRNLAWNYVELATVPGMTRDRLLASGSIEGLDTALAETAARGNTGAVIAFAHVGNIEVLGHLGVHLPGERFAVVVERLGREGVHEIVNGLRRCHGLDVIPADEPRRMLTALRSGTHLIVACDFDSLGGGLVTELFGRPARLPVGAVRLALATGAPLLMAEGWRDRDDDPGHYRAHIRGPLEIRRSGNREADTRAGVETLVALLERHVSAHPDQWLAFRDVFGEGRESFVSGLVR
jgi:lauroyl/myristoyl acyltransferase